MTCKNSKILLYDVNEHDDNDNDNTINNEIKLKNRLTHKDFQITTYTVRSIYTDFLEEKQIILRPSYQRNLTWSYDKMNYFLDSLFFFPIVPSFIICNIDKNELKEIRKNDKDSNLQWECIDGQHRLTVIDHYLSGKPIEINGKEKMLYIEEKIKDNTDKITKIKIFYKLTPVIEKKILETGIKKKDIRSMTIDERHAFNDTQLSFIKITKEIDKNTKCNLFNRLQQGEKVNSGTTTRNTDHPISNFIRDNKIVTEGNYDVYWKNILVYPRIKDTKYDELLNKMTFLIIKLLFITDKNTLDINYNDSNTANYIKENYGSTHLKDDNNINIIFKQILNINSTIEKILDGHKISEEFYFLLHKLVMDKNKNINILPLFMSDTKTMAKYNTCVPFYKKSANSQIVGNEMPKKYNQFLIELEKLNPKTKIELAKEDMDTDKNINKIHKNINNNKQIVKNNENDENDEFDTDIQNMLNEEIVIIKSRNSKTNGELVQKKSTEHDPKKKKILNYDNLKI